MARSRTETTRKLRVLAGSRDSSSSYLESIRWNKQPPVPTLPDDVVEKTREKYVQAFRLLSGLELE